MSMMMNLGGFPFMIETLPFQEKTRRTAWKWAEQDLIGTTPALQATGKEADTISLRGMLCPGFTGGPLSLTALRMLGDIQTPLPLVGGNGMFYGLWVIESIEESENLHFSNGSPRRMSFTINLKQYAGTIKALMGAADKLKQIPKLFS